MGAIAAHCATSQSGRLPIEDDRVCRARGRRPARDRRPVAARRHAHPGSASAAGVQHHAVDAYGHRRPSGATGGTRVYQTELANHRYVMVLHTHQANPHAQYQRACRGPRRQAPQPTQGRPAPVARETFAERLRGWGIRPEVKVADFTRGVMRRSLRGWGAPARRRQRTRKKRASTHTWSSGNGQHRSGALEAWAEITTGLGGIPRIRPTTGRQEHRRVRDADGGYPGRASHARRSTADRSCRA